MALVAPLSRSRLRSGLDHLTINVLAHPPCLIFHGNADMRELPGPDKQHVANT